MCWVHHSALTLTLSRRARELLPHRLRRQHIACCPLMSGDSWIWWCWSWRVLPTYSTPIPHWSYCHADSLSSNYQCSHHIHNREVPFLLLIVPYGTNLPVFKQLWYLSFRHIEIIIYSIFLIIICKYNEKETDILTKRVILCEYLASSAGPIFFTHLLSSVVIGRRGIRMVCASQIWCYTIQEKYLHDTERQAGMM